MQITPRPIRISFLAAICVAAIGVGLRTGVAQEVTLSAPSASEPLLDRLRRDALLLRLVDGEGPPSGADITAAARADYARLIGILYEAGFFAPVISIRLDGREASEISPLAPPDRVARVEITVQPGAPYRLGQARIGPLAPDTTLPEGFAPGQPANTALLRDATNAAILGWQNIGHANAAVSHQRIVAQHRDAVLAVDIGLAPGPVLQFGALLPVGQMRMRPDRIAAIAGLPSGESYSPAALARAEQRLRETGAFAAVALSLEPAKGDNTADVTAIVEEAPLRRLGFGAELASDAGIQLSAYWMHRNLLGGAERLRFDLAIAGIDDIQSGDEIDTIFTARFDRPASFGPDTALSLEAETMFLREPTYRIDGARIAGKLTHILSDEITISGGLGLEFSRIEDGLGQRDLTRLTLPLGLIVDRRDDPIDARRGSYIAADVEAFGLFGASNGARITLDGRRYWPIGARNATRFAARGQIGGIVGADLADIPPDNLFFSGGAGTVRGQPYRSLGAIQSGLSSGGRGFLGVSAELRHDLGDSGFGLVGFADLGGISAEAWDTDGTTWHSGAGVGLRYTTPFGPIRVDLATPTSGASAGRDLFLYIGIGQAF
ncbi:autotransporter assembly complex protein TamA [Roseicyclus sp.]|uniref:autotransporter assembly complex protein TamA n=1 Tax=Roseicyclus sp. TaxID=1914329 RepID=UPI003F6C69FE